ncbi:MAG: MFS transporter [Planctomycetota bacterium]
MSNPSAESALDSRPWWRQLNGYHWFVLSMAIFGWLFDTMDGQIFIASRSIAIKDLLGQNGGDVNQYGGRVTSMFILGWAIGGLLFGSLGDKWGRAKTMALTILVYAGFTGLSYFAQRWWDFGIYRFLTGMGVGGEFAAGASLVAEAMPEKARAKCLGLVQALSAVGNVIGALLFKVVEKNYGWRTVYFVGALPALLAVFAFLKLREPERWVKAKAAAKAATAAGQDASRHLGSISDLFRAARWRRNTLVGLALGIAGVLGLWGAGFFTPELLDDSFLMLTAEAQAKIAAVAQAHGVTEHRDAILAFSREDTRGYMALVSKWLRPADRVVSSKVLATPKDAAGAAEIETLQNQALATPLNTVQKAQVQALLAKALSPKDMTDVKAWFLILQNIGAFLGILMYAYCATRLGRRPAFLFAFLLGWFSVVFTFYSFHDRSQLWYMAPLLGFGTLAPFGGYAMYFPELFPTRLRNTGTSFCYNVGRFVAAIGPFTLGTLSALWEGKYETHGFRLAALVISCSYAIGLIALLWAPETRDEPLPEDEGIPAH